MRKYMESELIVNPDGSIYHLKLQPGQVAGTVILVGDQQRVAEVSKHFSKVEVRVQNREFLTHTGVFDNHRITVMSTGIGTDNIDIVLNELDALVNIDLGSRVDKEKHTSLDIIRLGTSGALQPDIAVDSFVASRYGLGFDGLLHFYSHNAALTETDMEAAFAAHTGWDARLPYPYIVGASERLMKQLAGGLAQGITATANGFFGPQGRELRIPLAFPSLNQAIENFEFGGHRITNFEMETSALYALARILGHQALTVCAIIANRVRKEYSKDYKTPVADMIRLVLERIVAAAARH